MRDLHDDEGRVAVEAAEGHASGAGMLRLVRRLSVRPVLLRAHWQEAVATERLKRVGKRRFGSAS